MLFTWPKLTTKFRFKIQTKTRHRILHRFQPSNGVAGATGRQPRALPKHGKW